MHYVVGDVHGCYRDMMDLFHKIDDQDREAVFILVGDLFDRGPEVDLMMQWVLENISLDGKYQTILGNHEDMILKWYDKWLVWYENGCKGDMPETKYDFSKWATDMHILEPAKLEPLIKLFRQLPLYKEITVELAGKRMEEKKECENADRQKYLIVHAFIYPDDMKSIRAGEALEQYRDTFIWDRGHCTQEYEEDEIILIHGHTPTISKSYINAQGKDFVPGMPARKKYTINLDTGHVYKHYGYSDAGELIAFCLETKEFI